jgi:hypothetical protein
MAEVAGGRNTLTPHTVQERHPEPYHVEYIAI